MVDKLHVQKGPTTAELEFEIWSERDWGIPTGETPLQELDTLGIWDQKFESLLSRSRAEFSPDRLMQSPNHLASVMTRNSSIRRRAIFI